MKPDEVAAKKLKLQQIEFRDDLIINKMKRLYISETKNKIGENVLLKGWIDTRRDHGKLIFIDLRDRSGAVQLVFSPAKEELRKIAEELRPEWVVEIEGLVKERPKAMLNTAIETGKIEIEVERIKVLNQSKTPPFDLAGDGYEINEETRLKYRYLDLRRRRLLNNLILRHKVIKYIRNFLDGEGFIEIETPILTKATPEGARDYVVPSRIYPGKFYALPQSPQQYKQLLMVAGIEKYFQIARCFRDEDTRGDRQPEFTQLDIEMSFASQEDILNLIEELYIKISEEVAGKKILQKPFPRFSYKSAMERFGDDKFDLRPAFAKATAGKQEKNPDILAFAWVTDFPLFEKTETKQIASSHHPFTAPKDEDIHFLESAKNEDLLKIRSWQHDLVCNGYEIAGGSVRITNPQIQTRIFEILGHGKEEIISKFGHLLTAFEYGVPPHGGIASGIERFLAILNREPNIREVMAFPKTGDGRDLMMEAPSEISEGQLKELNIFFKNNPQRS